ncbi:hypothetical protein RJ639_006251 [Escallonia herrerae]|uniref:Uncharacterized protein n=1 Tax=Escallonia herrerae TaxID=1293975 RepID=A0AA89AU71_9ASTE|nr:hypothetical protein RJ639_006251 [Escallonia herrerae]
MPAIQKLYNACKVSLSANGPTSEDAVEKVRGLLGPITGAKTAGHRMSLSVENGHGQHRGQTGAWDGALKGKINGRSKALWWAEIEIR